MESVQFFTRDQIETQAISVADQFTNLPQDNARRRMERVIQELPRFGADYEVADLTRDGTDDVQGYFDFARQRIVVDRSLVRSDQWPFVVAHELGHFVLHRHLRLHPRHLEPGYFLRDMVTGRHIIRSTYDKIEYQANQFGLAFALPQEFLLRSLVESQRKHGIVKNRGRIYVDHQPWNWNDLNRILFDLRNVFEIDRQAIRGRLLQLRWLVIKDTAEQDHVSRLFSRRGSRERQIISVPPSGAYAEPFTPAASSPGCSGVGWR